MFATLCGRQLASEIRGLSHVKKKRPRQFLLTITRTGRVSAKVEVKFPDFAPLHPGYAATLAKCLSLLTNKNLSPPANSGYIPFTVLAEGRRRRRSVAERMGRWGGDEPKSFPWSEG
jgi:hypothetical protein